MPNNTDPVRALHRLAESWLFDGSYLTGIPEIDERTNNRASAKRECAEALLEFAETLSAALASARSGAHEPEVHSYDPTDQRESVTIRWPEGKCLSYVLDRTRYTDNLPSSAPVGVDAKARRLYEMIFDAIAEDGSQQAEDACIRAIASALSQQPAAVDEAMRKVAAIAHSGGLLGLEEGEALTAIRRLSLPYWQKEERPEQVHATLAAQQGGV
jgi:hypothetical protein